MNNIQRYTRNNIQRYPNISKPNTTCQIKHLEMNQPGPASHTGFMYLSQYFAARSGSGPKHLGKTSTWDRLMGYIMDI